MREIFFIFLVLRTPTGVDIRPLERPYFSGQECADTAWRVFVTIQPKHPIVAGALCYSIDEFSGSEYLPMKRPL